MRIFIKTYGCSLNQSDSEVMAGLLKQAGHEIVSSAEEADLVVINTCTVKDPAEKKFFSLLEKYRLLQKLMVVSGCIPQADPGMLKDVSTVGVDQIDSICLAVEETIAGNIVHCTARRKGQRICLPKIRKNDLIEIIPLCQGCLGECSYCKTRYARGLLRSYSPKEIIAQFNEALDEGIYEFWLTAQDLGAYGQDIGTSLPVLLSRILDIKKDFRIRLGMMNPNHLKAFVDDMITIYKDPRVFKFLHLPLQSGSDRILKLMKRKYTAVEYVKVLDRLLAEIPLITLSTDVIVGFPSETEAEFEDTVRLVEKYKYPIVNISKYYPRQGTIGARMKKLDTKIVKQRSVRMTQVCDAFSKDERWIGWEGMVYVDEIGKPGSYMARNDWYKPIVIRSDKDILGKHVRVQIGSAEKHYLIGE